MLTVLGPVSVRRAYYYDKESRPGFCPKDRVLDVEGTPYSAGVRRIMSRVGAYRPFGLGQEDLYELAGLHVETKAIKRVARMVDDQVELFHAGEARAARSGHRRGGLCCRRWRCLDQEYCG